VHDMVSANVPILAGERGTPWPFCYLAWVRTTGCEPTNGQHVCYGAHVDVRQHVRAAIARLDSLASHGLTLATAQHADHDTWLPSGDSKHRREAPHFVRCSRGQKLTDLDFAANEWDGPAGNFDPEIRWQQACRLLHGAASTPPTASPGCSFFSTPNDPLRSPASPSITSTPKNTKYGSGSAEPIVLPEPLAQLVLPLVASRHGHATLGDQGTSPWLFPGGRPGRPISAEHLGERLRQLGLRPGQDRSGALFALATELPAALLARLLGIHISVAVAWQRASSGDWTNYAANYSRRQHTPNELADGTDDHLS
jgi:hypothetical protein